MRVLPGVGKVSIRKVLVLQGRPGLAPWPLLPFQGAAGAPVRFSWRLAGSRCSTGEAATTAAEWASPRGSISLTRFAGGVEVAVITISACTVCNTTNKRRLIVDSMEKIGSSDVDATISQPKSERWIASQHGGEQDTAAPQSPLTPTSGRKCRRLSADPSSPGRFGQ